MKWLAVILVIWITLLCFAQEKPDSCKTKLKRLIIQQQQDSKLDSIMVKLAKKDSIKQVKKK